MERKYLIRFDKPLKGSGLEGLVTIWGWACISLLWAEVFYDRRLLFNMSVLLGSGSIELKLFALHHFL